MKVCTSSSQWKSEYAMRLLQKCLFSLGREVRYVLSFTRPCMPEAQSQTQHLSFDLLVITLSCASRSFLFQEADPGFQPTHSSDKQVFRCPGIPQSPQLRVSLCEPRPCAQLECSLNPSWGSSTRLPRLKSCGSPSRTSQPAGPWPGTHLGPRSSLQSQTAQPSPGSPHHHHCSTPKHTVAQCHRYS